MELDEDPNSPQIRPMTSTHRSVVSRNLADIYENNDAQENQSDIEFINSFRINNVSNSIQQQDQRSQSQEFQIMQGLSRDMIKMIKRMKMGKSSKQCSVCFNSFLMGETIRKLPCEHIFHEICIIPWLSKNTKCPNCRFDIYDHLKDKVN